MPPPKSRATTPGAISWPVTAGNPNIDWLMAEYWMPNPGDTLRSSFADAGSSEAMLDIIQRNAQYLPRAMKRAARKTSCSGPRSTISISVWPRVIREHAPEVLFVHTGTFDSYRHGHGVFSSYLDEARANHDRYLGELMRTCEDAGVAQDTNLVLVSDHGQRDICRAINLNVLLADGGFIDTDADGKVLDWRAYCFSNAMSANVYLKDPDDAALKAGRLRPPEGPPGGGRLRHRTYLHR